MTGRALSGYGSSSEAIAREGVDKLTNQLSRPSTISSYRIPRSSIVLGLAKVCISCMTCSLLIAQTDSNYGFPKVAVQSSTMTRSASQTAQIDGAS